MAGIPLLHELTGNNNGSNTGVFRRYVRDNFEMIKANSTVLGVTGSLASQYNNNSHAMWIELGLDPKYCLVADYINGIEGDSDLTLLSTVYFPETSYLDELNRRLNRK